MRISTALILSLLFSLAASGTELENIPNYLEYNEKLASSGQPSAKQLEALSAVGFGRVINLAFVASDDTGAPEDLVAKGLGWDYVQIPVIWTTAEVKDFRVFAAVMQSDSDARTLVHCQANFRATAFSFINEAV